MECVRGTDEPVLTAIARTMPLVGLAASTFLQLISLTSAHLSWASWYTVLTLCGLFPSVLLTVLRRGRSLLEICPKLQMVILPAAIFDIVAPAGRLKFLGAIPEVVSGLPVLTVKGKVLRQISWDEYWQWSNAHIAFMAGFAAVMYLGCLLVARARR